MSLPFNFDPTERLLDPEGYRHIAELPYPGFLLRWYPHNGVFTWYHANDKADEAAARRVAEMAVVHQEQLSSHGIWIPRHQDFIGIRPESEDREIAIYSMVERVPNLTPLTDHDKETVKASLYSYLEWTIREGQDLLDVFIPEQFASIPPTPDGKTVVLLDIDPRFVPGDTYFRQRVSDLLQEF